MVSNPKNQGIFFVFQASIFKLLVFVFNKASFQWDMTSPIITFDFGNCTYLWLSMWIRQHLLTYILYSCWFGEFYHQNLYQMPMWNYKRGRRSFHEQKKTCKEAEVHRRTNTLCRVHPWKVSGPQLRNISRLGPAESALWVQDFCSKHETSPPQKKF